MARGEEEEEAALLEEDGYWGLILLEPRQLLARSIYPRIKSITACTTTIIC